jgi:hypothetical protein
MLIEYGHLLELVIIRRELLYPPVFVPSHMYICVCCCDTSTAAKSAGGSFQRC